MDAIKEKYLTVISSFEFRKSNQVNNYIVKINNAIEIIELRIEQAFDSFFQGWDNLKKNVFQNKNINLIQYFPQRIQTKVLLRTLESEEIKKFTSSQIRTFEENKASFKELKQTMDFAYHSGAKNEVEKICERMVNFGFKLQEIHIITGVSVDELELKYGERIKSAS